MATYFHSAPLLLDVGSVIQPGNWGRILNAYRRPNNGSPWLIAREMAFETIRASKYQNLPSRLSCAFVFESLDDANQYQGQFTPWNALYEVEMTDVNAPRHRGAFNLIELPPEGVEFLPVTVQRAEQYWSGSQIQVPEIITKSSLRILQMVSSGPWSYQP